MTFVCGIYVFGATWFLLGTNPEESVNETVAPQFMVSCFPFFDDSNMNRASELMDEPTNIAMNEGRHERLNERTND